MQAAGEIVVLNLVMSNLDAATMALEVIATACQPAKPTCCRCLCQAGYTVRRPPQAPDDGTDGVPQKVFAPESPIRTVISTVRSHEKSSSGKQSWDRSHPAIHGSR
jgi:hypothetical protein